jgi:hypothetical protein
MPRKKLSDLSQTHGKKDKFAPTSLDQIWGDTGLSKYNTFSAEEYQARLKEMNKADLRAHAAKMGIVPVDNRELIVKSLMRQFNLHVASYQRPKVAPNKNRPVSKEAMDILAEGK